jgi:uncharacterized protein
MSLGHLLRHRLRQLSRNATRALALVAAAVAVGCATSPPPVRFHSLIAPDAPFVEPTSPAGLMRISIVPVRIPAAIDRPQWLVRRPDDSLQMLEGDRWVAPLAEEFRFAMRARLASRWGIVDAARPRSGSELAPVAWRLVIDVLRLDARPGAETLLEARWTLLPPRDGGAGAACAARIVEPVETGGTQAIVEAYRRSLTLLSDQIGAQLRSIAAGGEPVCSTGAAPAA